LETRERLAYGVFVERHYRIAIVLLIASVEQRIQRQRIVVGCGDVLFDECAQHASFDGSQVHRKISCSS